MADTAAQDDNEHVESMIDHRCDYRPFSMKPDGKIACLGLGSASSDAGLQNAPISGIAFQKVDTGIVKAGIRVGDFTPVIWPNATGSGPEPTGGQQDQGQVLNVHNQIQLPQAPTDILQEWQEFTDSMGKVKNAMLVRMAPIDGHRPSNLLEGFQGGVWQGAENDSRTKTHIPIMASQVENDIRAGGLNWTNSAVINTWLEVMCNGLFNPESDFKCLFQYLFPKYGVPHNNYKQILRIAPSDSSKDGTLYDGVVHCLTYGSRERHAQPRHRTLVPKRLGLFTRSRSHSPASDADDEDLEDHVFDSHHPNYEPLIDDILDEPTEFNLIHNKLHVYFESHKPDLSLIEWREVRHPQNNAVVKVVARVKIIIEISAYSKVKAHLEHHVSENVEQCVQSCLAAFAHDQTLMYGIVVVVDGLKLIKVKKVQIGGGWQYRVSQTDLNMWDNAAGLHSLFNIINQQL